MAGSKKIADIAAALKRCVRAPGSAGDADERTHFRTSEPPRADVAHLLSPIYVAAVIGLLLNDHLLKQAIPGFVTGKLSDIFGLFAFAVFLSVLLPRRDVAVHATIALAFVVWKSPLSDPAILAWNTTMPFRIARVVDYSDLLALAVLPLSLFYLKRTWPALTTRKGGAVVVALVSLFAFTATSRAPGEPNISTGREEARKGQYERAIREYDEAIKQWPNLPEALYLRGIAKLNIGDTAGGEADLAKAASLDLKYRQGPVPPR
jgi:tetratricopeptide (TPR) repeat protein